MLSDKRLDKIQKILSVEEFLEIDRMSPEQLKDRIVQAESSIKNTLEELEANPKYEELKEDLKALSAGLREVKKRQNAIIQLCLDLLNNPE